MLAACLRSRGRLHVAQHEIDAAEERFVESLELVHSSGDRQALADWLEGWAGICLAREDARQAVVLLGAADGLRESIGAARAPDYRRWYDELLVAATERLSQDDIDASLAAGRRLGADDAAAQALTAMR